MLTIKKRRKKKLIDFIMFLLVKISLKQQRKTVFVSC